MEIMLGQTFWNLKHEGRLPVGRPIRVLWVDKQTYIFSPDGEGCYYYDTLQELQEQH